MQHDCSSSDSRPHPEASLPGCCDSNFPTLSVSKLATSFAVCWALLLLNARLFRGVTSLAFEDAVAGLSDCSTLGEACCFGDSRCCRASSGVAMLPAFSGGKAAPFSGHPTIQPKIQILCFMCCATTNAGIIEHSCSSALRIFQPFACSITRGLAFGASDPCSSWVASVAPIRSAIMVRLYARVGKFFFWKTLNPPTESPFLRPLVDCCAAELCTAHRYNG